MCNPNFLNHLCPLSPITPGFTLTHPSPPAQASLHPPHVSHIFLTTKPFVSPTTTLQSPNYNSYTTISTTTTTLNSTPPPLSPPHISLYHLYHTHAPPPTQLSVPCLPPPKTKTTTTIHIFTIPTSTVHFRNFITAIHISTMIFIATITHHRRNLHRQKLHHYRWSGFKF